MTFTAADYDRIDEGCRRSADVIVPLVYDLVKPEIVVDVGCGTGRFAQAFADRCVGVLAIDETVEHHEDGNLLWARVDLTRAWARHIQMTMRDRIHGAQLADLAVCLEVAEHLPESSAGLLVDQLVTIAPVVLFSAAVPGQGGHGHVNCQPPDYWADLFAAHGYLCSERLRWQLWDDERVEPWYRQNLLVFGRHDRLPYALLGQATKQPRHVVHPEIFAWYAPR